jgi:hypothetical protein
MFSIQPEDLKSKMVVHNVLDTPSTVIFKFEDIPIDKLSIQDQRRLYLSKFLELEKSFQITFPGSRYIGPGTHVIKNVLTDQFPKSQTDAAAMLHDIDYLIYAGKSQLYSDIKAVFSADPTTLEGLALIVGLTTKNLVGFHKDVSYKGLADVQTQRVGEVLLDYVQSDPLYSNILTEYNLLKPPSQNIDNLQFIDVK